MQRVTQSPKGIRLCADNRTSAKPKVWQENVQIPRDLNSTDPITVDFDTLSDTATYTLEAQVFVVSPPDSGSALTIDIADSDGGAILSGVDVSAKGLAAFSVDPVAIAAAQTVQITLGSADWVGGNICVSFNGIATDLDLS